MSLSLTETAVEKIKSLNEKNYYLRIGISGGGCSGLRYNLDFESEKKDLDKVIEISGIKILVDKKSLLFLSGTKLDYSDGLNGKGFEFLNPNAKKTCGCGSSFSA